MRGALALWVISFHFFPKQVLSPKLLISNKREAGRGGVCVCILYVCVCVSEVGRCLCRKSLYISLRTPYPTHHTLGIFLHISFNFIKCWLLSNTNLDISFHKIYNYRDPTLSIIPRPSDKHSSKIKRHHKSHTIGFLFI